MNFLLTATFQPRGKNLPATFTESRLTGNNRILNKLNTWTSKYKLFSA